MNPSSSSSDLQLVPETLLKRRHDLDALQAKRAASALTTTNSRKKSIAASAGSNKSIKIIKPETILARSRHRTNGSIRFRRVSKRGMQKRASDKVVMKRKVWDASKDEEADDVADDEKKGADAKSVDGTSTSSTITTSNDDDTTTSPNNLFQIQYKANSVGASSVFAVLLRPTDASTSKPIKKTLSTLRLRRVHEGVFLPYNPSTRKMLHLVEPYVLYGVLSLETVSDLVRRRGHCKVEGKRVPLSDNNVIEQQLGEELGLICVEDLVQVLTTTDDSDGGNVFGKVAKFLWPFRLTSRKSKFQRNMLQLKDGKLYGDQGELMNGYIREML
jgi:large subunit ribosomal protein L7e